MWSSTALINYLYGVKHEYHYNEKGELVITPIKLKSHKVGDKEIPSGFFFQPNSEHVSGILFSASGTISKFNRIGKQAGFGDPKIIMIRQGMCHNHDPNASVPNNFRYIVNTKCNETWAEGISLFHNSNAIHRISKDLFPSIAHHEFINGQIISFLPEFHPYSSFTINIRVEDK